MPTPTTVRRALPSASPRSARPADAERGYGMTTSSAVERYLRESRPPPDSVLAEMERHGDRDGIPIVVPETGEALRVLTRAIGARRVVEVGTAIGVSTLQIARSLPDGGVIVSFEVDGERHRAARGYLER